MTPAAWARRHDQFAELHFAYNPGLVAALKHAVPWTARRWHPDVKCWTVEEPFVDKALHLIEPVQVHDLRQPSTAPRPPSASPWAQVLHDALPERFRQPVYRAVLRVLHPDVGGDTQLAQELNDAFRRAS